MTDLADPQPNGENDMTDTADNRESPVLQPARRERGGALRTLTLVLCAALATYVGGKKPAGRGGQPEGQGGGQPGRGGVEEVPEGWLMPGAAAGFAPPPQSTNRLSAAQYRAGFALTRVSTNAAPDFSEPPGAAVTDWLPAGRGAHDEAWPVPLPGGFIPGGPLGLEDWTGRWAPVAWAAPSGVLLLDGPPDRLAPEAPDFGGASRARALSVLQTPAGLLAPEGRLWSATLEDGTHVVTWRNLMLGRDPAAKADLRCELRPDGGFTYLIAAAPGADVSGVTNWLIAAQDAGGGEAFAFAADAPLSGVLPPPGQALELRWTAFGQLDPDVPDTDFDGLSDWEEIFLYGTDPRNADTDGDGLLDGEEVFLYGTDPLVPDTLGTGEGDFWAVVDAASLTNAPWVAGGNLTLETGASAGALFALRVGRFLVPVRDGPPGLARITLPLDEQVPVALVAAPGAPPGAGASVAVAECNEAAVATDPDGIFTLPQEETRGGQQHTPPTGRGGGTGVIIGKIEGYSIALSTQVVCPHTGSKGLAAYCCVGGTPLLLLEAAKKKGEGTTASVTFSEEDLTNLLENPNPGPGAHQVKIPYKVSVKVPIDKKELSFLTNSVTGHVCIFPVAPPPESPASQPCGCSDWCARNYGGCFCDTCTCGHNRAPGHVPAAGTNTPPLNVTDRPDVLLLTHGGTADTVKVWPAPAGGGTPASKHAARLRLHAGLG